MALQRPWGRGLLRQEPQQPRQVAQFRVGGGNNYKFLVVKALCGAASQAAETLAVGHTFSFRLSRAWRRVKMLVQTRGQGVPCLTLIKLSIAGKILGMNKISVQGDNGTCGVLWSNLGVRGEKNESTTMNVVHTAV